MAQMKKYLLQQKKCVAVKSIFFIWLSLDIVACSYCVTLQISICESIAFTS